MGAYRPEPGTGGVMLLPSVEAVPDGLRVFIRSGKGEYLGSGYVYRAIVFDGQSYPTLGPAVVFDGQSYRTTGPAVTWDWPA